VSAEAPASFTDIAAIYAAIVATAAFALEFRRWFESGPKLLLNLISQAQIYGFSENDEGEYLHARTTNRGDRPTTISNYALHQYKTPFHRWLNKSSRSAIVTRPDLFGGLPVPYVLQPGTEWSGVTKYDDELIDWAKTGKLYVAIYSSHSNHPIVKRVSYSG
jgi:hypothetical protein